MLFLSGSLIVFVTYIINGACVEHFKIPCPQTSIMSPVYITYALYFWAVLGDGKFLTIHFFKVSKEDEH
jgi:hypothetical protein